MDKLKYDPFNAEYNNPLGCRGFSNATYTPSKLELTQMSAFDHIVTQGRLLGLTADPYERYNSINNDINPNFGCVGNGGLAPDGYLYGGDTSGSFVKNQSWAWSANGNVVSSKDYIFNTSNSDEYWMDVLPSDKSDFYQLSFQDPDLPNYGLTLLAHERAMVDEYFKVTCQSLGVINGFKTKVGSGNITINFNVKTKNLRDDNYAPYGASLTLNFKNTSLSDDVSTAGRYPIGLSKPSFGYVPNISPIIERKTT
jgi:hypothetical protein